jgi:hypothetical protein
MTTGVVGLRPTVLRIAGDCVLLAGLCLLIVFGIGSALRTSSTSTRIYPGPRPVSLTQAQRCLAATPWLTVSRVDAKTITVQFSNAAKLHLAFLHSETSAMRAAPWSFTPALPRTSLDNVVITRPPASIRPPRSELKPLGHCLLTP